MRKRASLFDKYEKEIKQYLKLGLSLRCIYLLISHKMKKHNIKITYQGLRNYVKNILKI